MFGSDSGKEISLDMLDKEIGAFFDRKLERFAARAEKISAQVRDTKKRFMDACDEFGRVSAEPDLEFKMWLSPGFIKGQKGAYATALKKSF